MASLSMADVLANSSNIGAIQIGLKVGDQHYVRIRRGISDSGARRASSCRANRRECCGGWRTGRRRSIGSVAMGHEVSATSLQLALAGAVIANGGMLVKPQLILARQKPGEAEERFAPEKPERVICAGDGDPDAPDDGRRGAARHGPRYATMKGYTSGGKTGIGADLRFEGARVYASIQRELSWDSRRWRIRRSWSR